MKIFGHVFYFSEDLLMPPPTSIFSLILRKLQAPSWQKLGAIAPKPVPWPCHWLEIHRNVNNPHFYLESYFSSMGGAGNFKL